jgi:hypothetical protein
VPTPSGTIIESTISFAPTGGIDFYDQAVRYGAVDSVANPASYLIHRKYTLSAANLALEWRVRNTITNALFADWSDVPQSDIIINPENISGQNTEVWLRRNINSISTRDIDIDVRVKNNPASEVLGTLKWQPAIILMVTSSQSNAANLISGRAPPFPTNQESRFHITGNNFLVRVAETFVGSGIGLLAERTANNSGLPRIIVDRAVANSLIESWLMPGSGTGGTSSNWQRNREEWLRWGKWNAVIINIGETNSTVASTLPTFRANMLSAIGDLRTLVNQTPAQLPVMVNITGAVENGSDSGLNSIRESQLALHDPVTNRIFVSSSAVGFSLVDEGSGDVHYITEDYNRLGLLYASGLNEVIGGTVTGTAGQSDPLIVSSRRTGDVILLTVQHNLGTDIVVPANAGLALKVRLVSDNSAVVPASIERISPTSFSITLPANTGPVQWRNVDGNAFNLSGNQGLIVDNDTTIGARPLMPSPGWQSENTQ